MHSAAFALPRAPTVLARGREGDRATTARAEPEFRRIYDANATALLRYLTRSTSSPELAEDLLQDVFFRYVRAGFAGTSDEHRRRYLFKIASNLVVDHFRRPRAQRVDLEDAPAAELASRPATSLGYDLDRMLAELSLRDRQLLWLAHVEGFSHREIGRLLDLSTASVGPALFRARKRLGSVLNRHGIGPEVLSR